MLTILLDQAESLDTHCTVEIFNDLLQLLVHFFDPLRVGQPIQRPLCDDQHLPSFRKVDYPPKRPRLTYSHKHFATCSITLNIRWIVFCKISVSS